MKPFYIGLSCVSNNPAGYAGRAAHGGMGRALHAEGRRVLALLDAEGSGSAREPAAIAAESGGRPFFTGRHADFNISHSQYIAAVAWSEAVNPANGLPFRVGCDIQYVSPGKNREAIARKYYSPGENSYIAAAEDDADRIDRFYRIWVLKESCLKAAGLSVLDMRDSPSFAGRESLGKDPSLPFDFFLYELGSGTAGRCLLAVCRENPLPDPARQDPGIRWYSPALALKPLSAPLRSLDT
ncbi:MAG: 4'-phosphopantetheinyl transferase superfamily protein [Spirochaetaceae bacterium]|jgi:phosphopantetheinyl transferase|nr:4'-phosphopantetheinyl transferase superfamily protein [Spirochaetaceae bacterium]